MRIKVTFKAPDGIYESIRGAIDDLISNQRADINGGYYGESNADRCERRNNLIENVIPKALSKWIEFGEYVAIEFDTDAMTAKVLENIK